MVIATGILTGLIGFILGVIATARLGEAKQQESINLEEKYSPSEWSSFIHTAMRDAGFWDKRRNIGELLMLVNSELCEALEADRVGRKKAVQLELDWNDEGTKELFEKNIKDSFEDEIADAVIRLFDLAGGLDISLDYHIYHKYRYNMTRQKKHGKKY